MFIRCCGGHDTVLSKILNRRHPFGPVTSMWAPTGAEKARQEIKEARSFVCAPSPTQAQPPLYTRLLPVTHTYAYTRSAPIFSYYCKHKGKKDKKSTC